MLFVIYTEDYNGGRCLILYDILLFGGMIGVIVITDKLRLIRPVAS
jgi:hypothetical protein